MKRATVLAHEQISAVLEDGDYAVDATVGNGHDTLFLAKLVGSTGRVMGFDIQAEALASARKRLCDAGVLERISLVHASHAELKTHCSQSVKAIMFNLGYLPGGDQEKITRSASTLEALDQSLDLLEPGGLLTCVCYPGHPGGLEEAEAVLAWATSVEDESFTLTHPHEKGRHEGRPFLVSLQYDTADD